MRIYLLINWEDYDFARFSHTGTWSEETESCAKCEYSNQHLIEPLQIEWEPGSDSIGDFSWCGYTIIVLDRVKEYLIEKEFGCDFGKIEVKKTTTPKKKRKNIPFPYKGPTLNWLMPKKVINLDTKKSGLEIDENCSICNRLQFRFKMDGLVIPKEEIKGLKMFKITQFGHSSATFITEDSLKELLDQNFSNFWYKEAGSIR